MLDDVSLAQKARVARRWFRKARQGEMKFTAGTSVTFEQLLEAIEMQANSMEAENNILRAQATVRDFEIALHMPQAIAAAPNVVRLPRPTKGTSR